MACARLVDDTLGNRVSTVERIDTGEVLVKELQRANVDISGVRRVAGGSGQGFVLEDGGTVLSVVNKGANHAGIYRGCDDAWAAEVVQNARVVLLQREVPERINEVVASSPKAGAIVVQDCGVKKER